MATLLAVLPVCAETVTKDYQLRDFTGISASSIVHVDLRPSDRFSVKVEAPDYILPYLKVEVRGKQLSIRITDMTKAISRKLSGEKGGVIRAEVRMPILESVELSGASKLDCDGAFPALRNDTFRMKVSGASQVKGLSVSAAEANIQLSGATLVELTGQYDKVDLDASGAGRSRLDISAGQLDIELSGSARIDFDGSVRRVELEASGASKADLRSSSTLTSLSIEGSGAASIDTRNARAEDVSVEISGASNCKVSALRSIEIEASRASTCLYEASSDTRINIIQVSRGASVRRL